MASRKEAREALAEDLRALGDDLKAFLQDPKERNKKERRWRVFYGAVALVTTLVGRRIAAKLWSILTGEQPPVRGGTAEPSRRASRSETPASHATNV
jgi:hypothetical protein